MALAETFARRRSGYTRGGLTTALIFLPPALVLSTAHEPYRRLDMADLANRGVEAIVDGRAAWHPEEARAAGLVYVGVGRP